MKLFRKSPASLTDEQLEQIAAEEAARAAALAERERRTEERRLAAEKAEAERKERERLAQIEARRKQHVKLVAKAQHEHAAVAEVVLAARDAVALRDETLREVDRVEAEVLSLGGERLPLNLGDLRDEAIKAGVELMPTLRRECADRLPIVRLVRDAKSAMQA